MPHQPTVARKQQPAGSTIKGSSLLLNASHQPIPNIHPCIKARYPRPVSFYKSGLPHRAETPQENQTHAKRTRQASKAPNPYAINAKAKAAARVSLPRYSSTMSKSGTTRKGRPEGAVPLPKAGLIRPPPAGCQTPFVTGSSSAGPGLWKDSLIRPSRLKTFGQAFGLDELSISFSRL